MARIKTRLPKGGTLILLWIGVIILLGLVGWGIGWLVPRVLAPRETPTPTPTQMARPTATSTMVDVPTDIPTAPEATDIPPTPTAASPEGASEPSSEPTAAPVIEPTLIAEENEVVQSGDGLFQVCRRHCPERWPPDDDTLTTYAQQVAELTGLSWPDPALSPGQILKMPPCP